MSEEIKRTGVSEDTEFHQAEPAELDEGALHEVAGGRMAETKWTYCGQGGPTECYKPNPY